MTTQAGTIYRQLVDEDQGWRGETLGRHDNQEEGRDSMLGGRDGTSMVEMMQVLLEDRRRREMEQAEERRMWDEERRHRDLEFEDERRRQQEESSSTSTEGLVRQKFQREGVQPNDMVLLLLPKVTSKLLAQWQGPFRVVKKVGRVNYKTEMPHRRKKKQTYHTILFKKWEPPSVLCSMASEVDDEEEDFPDWRENKTQFPASF